MAALIEAKNITNKFGRQAIHDHLNLNLEENEILGVIGGSGSGKSVLLRTMLGLHRPQGGKVLVDGKSLYALPEEERLSVQKKWGVLFQNGALFSGLTVIDNIALPLREHTDLSPEAVCNLAFLKLQMVGLSPETADKYPSALSGGMITRAAMARAMALDPGVLFLDEPTGALDPVSASALDDLMIALRDTLKLSILVITHDLATIVGVCDRIAIIADKKVETGSVEELAQSSNPKVREFFDSPRVKEALTKRRKRN
jgi:phospholipid/cholesterol/gamma-HCH transport system ATP-binding protein